VGVDAEAAEGEFGHVGAADQDEPRLPQPRNGGGVTLGRRAVKCA
jgi:hypothetical protein